MLAKEYRRPRPVQGQLCAIGDQRELCIATEAAAITPHQVRAKAHASIECCPDGCKYPVGWPERGKVQVRIPILQIVPRQLSIHNATKIGQDDSPCDFQCSWSTCFLGHFRLLMLLLMLLLPAMHSTQLFIFSKCVVIMKSCSARAGVGDFIRISNARSFVVVCKCVHESLIAVWFSQHCASVCAYVRVSAEWLLHCKHCATSLCVVWSFQLSTLTQLHPFQVIVTMQTEITASVVTSCVAQCNYWTIMRVVLGRGSSER